ncbi:ArnT family glycosyltransferase [Mariniblastus fucicola]|uniref:Uncharacterized protein n=1 Tax=Mariniblastus fucicola TaxID=980251 RepID=A0A5B9P9I9_9BACT|nr:glycosyltransferase family 39 protein [Mariniblastus fucicola]QEG21570.1 hypothetical protein MFFC18_14280 [Mariniblastus fucicola]
MRKASDQLSGDDPSFRMKVFAIAFAATFSVLMIWTASRGGEQADPPAPWNVDGIFYDNIAFNINRGKGFAVDLDVEPWRDSYLQSSPPESDRVDLDYGWLRPVKGTGPTTLRSPMYPYALSLIYRTFGHRYNVARIFGCIFVGLGLALLLTFSASRWGYFAALTSGTTLAFDYSVMNSAGTLATESLAILVFATTFVLVVNAYERASVLLWAIAGVSFAALMLTRGIWSLGYLVLVVSLIGFWVPAIRTRLNLFEQKHLFAFLAAATVFAMPWWIRNCQTTGHFTPFGTAGSCGFVAAYCDESLENFGHWQEKVFNQNQIEVQKDVDMETIKLADLEYITGQESMRKTKAWCLANWNLIPQLMGYRGFSHWGFSNTSVSLPLQLANIWLVVIGLIGCTFFTGRLRGVFIVVLLLDSLLVMLTWEHLGRYAIPIRPVVHLGYGLAISAIASKFMVRFDRRTAADKA